MKSSKLILLLQGGTSGLGETRGDRWALLGTAWHICANFATCSREPLTMLNPQSSLCSWGTRIIWGP